MTLTVSAQSGPDVNQPRFPTLLPVRPGFGVAAPASRGDAVGDEHTTRYDQVAHLGNVATFIVEAVGGAVADLGGVEAGEHLARGPTDLVGGRLDHLDRGLARDAGRPGGDVGMV